MSHYAKIDENGIVTQVIVADFSFICTGAVGDPSEWISTSYNTFAGKHTQGGTPFRKNYASIGFKFDRERNAFIPPQPFPSWLLNEETCQWYPPVAMPIDGKRYFWNEVSKGWVEAKK